MATTNKGKTLISIISFTAGDKYIHDELTELSEKINIPYAKIVKLILADYKEILANPNSAISRYIEWLKSKDKKFSEIIKN